MKYVYLAVRYADHAKNRHVERKEYDVGQVTIGVQANKFSR